jgi:hypothetical protein
MCCFPVRTMFVVNLQYDDLFQYHFVTLMQALIIGLYTRQKHHITKCQLCPWISVHSLKVHCISSLCMIDTFRLLTYRTCHIVA